MKFAALLLPFAVLFVATNIVRAQVVSTDETATIETAKAHYDAKQYDLAVAAYQRVESSSPHPSVKALARFQIAESHGKKGDHAKARQEFLQVLARYPQEKRLAAKSSIRAGDYALKAKAVLGAIADYERAAKPYDSSAEARELSAESALKAGRLRVQIANNRRSEVKSPADSAKADDALRLAQRAMERVAKEFPDRASWASVAQLELLELKQQGELYGAGNTHQEVVASATAYLKLYPKDTRRGATARLIATESLYFEQNYDAALQWIASIDQKLAAPVVQGTAQRLLAQCYDGKGDYERAIVEYRKFLDGMTSFKAWIDRPLAQYSIGMCLKALHKNEEAIAALAKVKEENPKSHLVPMAQSVVAELSAR